MHPSREELVNITTHAAGIIAGALGGAFLIVLASMRGDARLIVGAAIFTAAVILLYSASTLYHAARSSVIKQRLKILDHAAIYLLIAGTYTPFTLAGLRGAWGWSLFGVIWGLACVGMIFKLFFTGRYRVLSTAIYIAMGWLVLIAVVPLVRALPATTLGWLVGGGVTYTLGTLFYHSPRPYAHGVWHLFVLAGTVCHGIAIATL